MIEKTLKTKFTILDGKGIERSYTFSIERAVNFAKQVSQQTGKSTICWMDPKTKKIKKRFFLQGESTE